MMNPKQMAAVDRLADVGSDPPAQARTRLERMTGMRGKSKRSDADVDYDELNYESDQKFLQDAARARAATARVGALPEIPVAQRDATDTKGGVHPDASAAGKFLRSLRRQK